MIKASCALPLTLVVATPNTVSVNDTNNEMTHSGDMAARLGGRDRAINSASFRLNDFERHYTMSYAGTLFHAETGWADDSNHLDVSLFRDILTRASCFSSSATTPPAIDKPSKST
jgi:hypothetical protein